MCPFDNDIVNILNKVCHGDRIETVGLGIYDFAVYPQGGPWITTRFKAVFFLKGQTHVWQEGPTDIPVTMVSVASMHG